MLERFECDDSVLQKGSFLADEVAYNIIYRICDSETKLCWKTADDTMIFAKTPGNSGWLWMAPELSDAVREGVARNLAGQLYREGIEVTGISGSPELTGLFARVYPPLTGQSHRLHIKLAAYRCPVVRQPTGIGGAIRKAGKEDIKTVAGFIAAFTQEAYGQQVEVASQIPAAAEMVESGELYVWVEAERIVSMAAIAHRTARHARINAVYTALDARNRGFASAVVAEVSAIIVEGGLEPMLYADVQNSAANKAYRNIGFIPSGQISEYRFS
ncbi:GNAT family N-acetyltransferase [Paenibacillus sp. FSL H8-0537]|uniref:GNAT family N-acetyltransferase n=1 Tax=Paenibacillus sp. FSL H8-0537 TaxID=2921399 RepID=UPI0031010CD6